MREDLRLMKTCQAVFWLAAPPGLRYALSYLAKQDQKEHGIILMRSRLPEKVTAADHDTTELQLY